MTTPDRHPPSQTEQPQPRPCEPGAPAPGERLTYTVPEGAALLGTSQSFVWKQIKAGAIPVVRLGRRTLIRRAALLSAIERLEGKERDGGQAPDAHEQGRLRVMK